MTTAHIEGAPTHAKIAQALSKLQAALPVVTLDGDNPHFKSKFMTLGNLSSVLLPELSKHGLSYATTSRAEDGKLVLEANLLHESGESLTAEFLITETQPQKVGSAVTYFRRYGLAALTGVVADGDDDANAASAAAPAAVRKQQERKAAPKAAEKPGSARQKVRVDWIDAGKADKESVNALVAAVKAEDAKLTGDAVFEAVLARLGAGEVG